MYLKDSDNRKDLLNREQCVKGALIGSELVEVNKANIRGGIH